jgi:hypothetical protein
MEDIVSLFHETKELGAQRAGGLGRGSDDEYRVVASDGTRDFRQLGVIEGGGERVGVARRRAEYQEILSEANVEEELAGDGIKPRDGGCGRMGGL